MSPRPTNWSSDNPNAAIPNTVKARVVLRQAGRCALSGVRLRPGHIDFDHTRPLSMGGLHAEDNIRAVDRPAHQAKTAEEAGPRAKADRIRIKSLGLKRRSKAWGNLSKKMNGEIVRKEAK